MSSKTDQPTENPKYLIKFIFICILIIAISAIYFVAVQQYTDGDAEIRGTFGDMFGALTAIFSGFAFAGVIVTILMQMKELELTRTELRRSADAQEESQKALNEQLKSMELTAKIQNLQAYINTLNDSSSPESKEIIIIIKSIIESSNLHYLAQKENLNFIKPKFVIKYQPTRKNEYKGKPIIFEFRIQNHGARAKIDEMKLPSEIKPSSKYTNPLERKYIPKKGIMVLEVNSLPQILFFDIFYNSAILENYMWKQRVNIRLDYGSYNQITISEPLLISPKNF